MKDYIIKSSKLVRFTHYRNLLRSNEPKTMMKECTSGAVCKDLTINTRGSIRLLMELQRSIIRLPVLINGVRLETKKQQGQIIPDQNRMPSTILVDSM